MKRVGKLVVFIVVLLIGCLSFLAFFGIDTYYGDKRNVIIKGANDIRWGIDISGGVDVTFTPANGFNASNDDIDAAEEMIKTRLVAKNITDSETYVDYNKNRIIVRFPWKSGEEDFDAEKAIAEIAATAELSFREGTPDTLDKKAVNETKDTVVMTGADVDKATAGYNEKDQKYIVSLDLNADGTKKFAESTTKLAGNGTISILMDDNVISYPTVDEAITGGKAQISGNFDAESAQKLAEQINGGALPFALEASSYSTISPSLGSSARDIILWGGLIAFIIICLYMIFIYRLPGAVAAIALVGQVVGTIAVTSGFFPNADSFTLTLPGIAGIILGVGMGVDANVITAERVKDELRAGKTLDGSIDLGFSRGFTAVFDSNITNLITAIVLIGAFGSSSGILSKILNNTVFFMFGPSTTGTIYSFGMTLLVSVVMNFIFGVGCTRLMIKSLSRFKALRKPWLFGGAK